jgi:hypothetical protein
MRTPGRGVQQLHLLCHHQGPELGGKALGEVGVGEHRRPVLPAIAVILELPEMDELVDRPGIALEIADQVLVVTALLQRRKAELLVQFDGFGHLADIERVCSEFV